MANTKYLLDKAADGRAAVTPERAGEIAVDVGIIDIAKVTTPATTDAIGCVKLPARHRLVDLKVWTDDLATDSNTPNGDIVVMDEDTETGDQTADKVLMNEIILTGAGLIRLGDSSYTTIADVKAMLGGYFAVDRIIGFKPTDVTGLDVTGKIYIEIQSTPIMGWETLIEED